MALKHTFSSFEGRRRAVAEEKLSTAIPYCRLLSALLFSSLFFLSLLFSSPLHSQSRLRLLSAGSKRSPSENALASSALARTTAEIHVRSKRRMSDQVPGYTWGDWRDDCICVVFTRPWKKGAVAALTKRNQHCFAFLLWFTSLLQILARSFTSLMVQLVASASPNERPTSPMYTEKGGGT